jgi:hypothetical protein
LALVLAKEIDSADPQDPGSEQERLRHDNAFNDLTDRENVESFRYMY